MNGKSAIFNLKISNWWIHANFTILWILRQTKISSLCIWYVEHRTGGQITLGKFNHHSTYSNKLLIYYDPSWKIIPCLASNVLACCLEYERQHFKCWLVAVNRHAQIYFLKTDFINLLWTPHYAQMSLTWSIVNKTRIVTCTLLRVRRIDRDKDFCNRFYHYVRKLSRRG